MLSLVWWYPRMVDIATVVVKSSHSCLWSFGEGEQTFLLSMGGWSLRKVSSCSSLRIAQYRCCKCQFRPRWRCAEQLVVIRTLPIFCVWTSGNAENLEAFYPTTLVERRYDILLFLYSASGLDRIVLTGKPSFEMATLPYLESGKNVHNLSKFLGNVIDPLNFIKGAALIELKKLKFMIFLLLK